MVVVPTPEARAERKIHEVNRIVMQVLLLLVTLVVVLCVFVAVVVSHSADTLAAQQKTSSRTECKSQVNNAVTDKRWEYIGSALEGSVNQSRGEVAQAVRNLNALKGSINALTERLCPSAVKDTPVVVTGGLGNIGTSTTTTTGK